MPTVDVDGALAFLGDFLTREAPGFAERRDLADLARATSVAYTETRAIDHDAAADLAYLAHFGPRAIVAVARAIAALPPGEIAHVVDMGAGSGASALAWAFAGARSITLVERSDRALQLARRLLGRCPGLTVATRTADVTSAAPIAGASHVCAAFVVGELDDDVDVSGLLARVAPGATAVLVDAGDRPRARRLQQLRDALVLRGDLVIHGPCPHREPCPALVRDRDWCHDRVAKRLPPGLAAFARRVGRDDVAMSLAWLVYGPGRPETASGVVVIGEPRREKGRLRVPVCGPGGLRFLQVLQRDKPLFRSVAGLERGTHLPAPAASVSGDTWHLGTDDISMLTEAQKSNPGGDP